MSHAFATHSFATYLTRRMYDHSSSSRCLAFDSIGMVCLPTGRTEQVLLLLRAVCTTKTGLLGPAASPRNRICVCSAYVCVSQMAHSLVLFRLLPLVRRRRLGGHWLPTAYLPTSSRRICACLYQPPTERSKSGDGGVKRGDNQWFTVVDFLKDDLVFPWVELPRWAGVVTLSALSITERTVNSLQLL